MTRCAYALKPIFPGFLTLIMKNNRVHSVTIACTKSFTYQTKYPMQIAFEILPWNQNTEICFENGTVDSQRSMVRWIDGRMDGWIVFNEHVDFHWNCAICMNCACVTLSHIVPLHPKRNFQGKKSLWVLSATVDGTLHSLCRWAYQRTHHIPSCIQNFSLKFELNTSVSIDSFVEKTICWLFAIIQWIPTKATRTKRKRKI